MTGLSFIVNLAFCAFYARFAWIHAHLLFAGQLGVLPFVVQETLLAVFFLIRRPSESTSKNPVDWITAGVGTFTPLLIQGGMQPYAIGVPLQVIGVSLSIYALCHLGRSFGIVPSNRGVVYSGPYWTVRHPMYAAHFLTLAGFLLTYPSMRTAGLIALTMAALVGRTYTEEATLLADPEYILYFNRVRWRLIPGVF
jgi:protein-S-isoprenylcysteine O-methyltransferase Ste14